MPRRRRKEQKPVVKASTAGTETASRTGPSAEERLLLDSILALTADVTAVNETFPKLHGCMTELLSIQKDRSVISKLQARTSDERQEAIENLISWLSSGDVDCSGVTVADYGDRGFGLKARRPFSTHEVILQIPRKFIMASSDGFKSEIEEFLRSDHVCSGMNNMALSMFLLHELCKGEDSHWRHYINSLPTSYYGFLFISVEEFSMLKGSPTCERMAADFRRLCRQYAIFVMQLSRIEGAQSLSFRNNFTWEDFRWALATVMSRNNPIPDDNGETCSLGLVPLWDMGNHEIGELTTDYNLETESIVFHAMRDFDKDEEIVFNYGTRSNSELLTYCGFVVDHNPYDRFDLKLGVSSLDPLYRRRMHFIKEYNLDDKEGLCLLRCEPNLPWNLLGFARIFVMKEKDLTELEACPPPAKHDLCRSLTEPSPKYDTPSAEILSRSDNDALSFLKLRLQLLLSAVTKPRQVPDTPGGAMISKTMEGEAFLLENALERLKPKSLDR